VIYIALLEKIGFFILTPLFLFVLPYMVGFRRYRLITMSVIVVTAALYGVFVEVLNIPLPQGLLGD
jgi:putative tricarboxylic transport membrane protein